MLSETLITPHPRKQKPDDQVGLLHEQINLNETASHLVFTGNHDPLEHDNEVLHTAQNISRLVHKSLWFEYNPDSPLPITEEHIGEHQRTSCFGYAICASECMEKAGIEHWVAFANNHAFILVPLRGRGTTLLINPTNPKLDGEIPTHQEQITPTAIDDAIGNSKRGFAWFSADAYAKYTKDKDFLKLASLDLGGWLTTETRDAIIAQLNDNGRGALTKAPSKIAQERRLVVAIYPHQAGRDIMQQFGLFQHYTGTGDTDRAIAQLEALGTLYPEIDSRSPQYHFIRFLDKLADEGEYAKAHECVTLLHSSLAETKDPRADILRADLIRRLGRHAQSEELLMEADGLYVVAERDANKNIIIQKRLRIANIIRNLKLSQRN